MNALPHPQQFCELWKTTSRLGRLKIAHKQTATETQPSLKAQRLTSYKLAKQRHRQLSARVRRDMEELILFLFHAGHSADLIWLKVKEAFPDDKMPTDFIIKTLRARGNLEKHNRVNLITPEDFSNYPADPSWRLLPKKMQIAPRPKNHPETVGDYYER